MLNLLTFATALVVTLGLDFGGSRRDHPGIGPGQRSRTVARRHCLGGIVRRCSPVTMLAAAAAALAPDLAPLRYDDIDVLSRVRDVPSRGPTVTGPLTSWGVPDPPGSVYLMLPAALMPAPPHPRPWSGAACSTSLAVVLTYLLVRALPRAPTALVAGLLFAVNPWAVYFSRRSWAEIVPLFTVVALWSRVRGRCGGGVALGRAVLRGAGRAGPDPHPVADLRAGRAADAADLAEALGHPLACARDRPGQPADRAVPDSGLACIGRRSSATLAEGNRGIAEAPRSERRQAGRLDRRLASGCCRLQ